MGNDIYTIKRLSEELGQARQNVRRRIIKLDIRAVNQDKRLYKNEPLKYNHKDFVKIAEDFGILISTTKEQQSNTQRTVDDIIKDNLIEFLKEQLEIANKSRDNLEKLLNQQQQLSLNNINKIKLLEVELKDVNEVKKKSPEENVIHKSMWNNIFKKNK